MVRSLNTAPWHNARNNNNKNSFFFTPLARSLVQRSPSLFASPSNKTELRLLYYATATAPPPPPRGEGGRDSREGRRHGGPRGVGAGRRPQQVDRRADSAEAALVRPAGRTIEWRPRARARLTHPAQPQNFVLLLLLLEGGEGGCGSS